MLLLMGSKNSLLNFINLSDFNNFSSNLKTCNTGLIINYKNIFG